MGANKRFKASIKEVLESILAILLVLECNTVYQRMLNADLHFDWMCIGAAFLLVLSSSRIINKRTLNISFAVLTAALIYLVLTFYKSNVLTLIYLLCLFLPCNLLYLMNKKETGQILSIYQKFSTIIMWLAVASTTVWFLTEIANVLTPNMSVSIEWGTEHTVNGVFGLYFECQLENTFGFYIYRNSGIFCEAPMFSLVLSLALMYELFLHGEIRRKRIVVLVISILTTLTSTGLIMLVLCFGLLYWQKIKTGRKWVRILYTIGVVILIPVVYTFFSYLIEAKSVRGSYFIRLVDYIVGFQAFLKYPITGSGFGSISRLTENKASLLASYGLSFSSVGYSNSLTAVIGQGGIYLSMLYLLPFVRLLMKKTDGKRNYSAWVISLMVLFAFTIFYAKTIMIYFIAVAYALCFILKEEKNACCEITTN